MLAVNVSDTRRKIYVSNFFFSLQFGLAFFFNATFLSSLGLSEKMVGIVFAFSYAASLVLLFSVPLLLRKFGNYSLFFSSSVFLVCVSALLAFSLSPIASVLLVATLIVLNIFLYTLLDIFLESAVDSTDGIGKEHGLFLTVTHGGRIVAQLAAGTLLLWGGFTYLYGTVAGVVIILAFITAFFLRNVREPVYEKLDFASVLLRLYYSTDMRHVFKLQFLLYLFYSIMAVYTPIYLYEYVGLSLGEMGIVFAIMLAPFFLLEILIGKFEDVRGEKGVLMYGFLILAVTTAALSLISTSSIVIWTVALFATRIGALMVEMGNDVYFFKHIDASKAAEVAAFRALFPLAFAIGPFLGVVLLFFIPLYAIFASVGVIMLLGLVTARTLTDIH